MLTNDHNFITFISWSATVYVLVKIFLKVWSLIKQYILPFVQPQDFKKYGQWAVITGCTDGIGKGFAKELASKGLDICLISRNEDKLKNTATEIEDKYGVKTKYIVADFTDLNIYSNIRENLTGLDIGILVNNVGIIADEIEPFSNQNEEIIKDCINVNLMSLTMMTSLVLPCMMRKRNGLILNMSSFGSELILPYLAVYCGCKAYITMFGSCLSYELKKHNIQMTTLIPGFISTRLLHSYPYAVKPISILPLLIATVEKFVKSALLTASSGCNKTCGYLIHEFCLLISYLFPTGTWTELALYVKRKT